MKELSGSLKANDKGGVESRPDIRGTCLIGGVEYWVSGWRKIDDHGKPWYSLQFQPKAGPGSWTKADPPALTVQRTGPAASDPFL